MDICDPEFFQSRNIHCVKVRDLCYMVLTGADGLIVFVSAQ